MELRQLEYFAAVVHDGSYTAAAARLHVAQPALWKQVNQLERELGVSLFERVGRRVRVTTAGALLLDQVDRVLAGADRVRTMADELRTGRTGRVRVGCFSPHIAAFLASVVADFRIAHPHIAVDLVEQGLTARNPVIDGGPSLLEALRAGVIDVITTSAVEDDGDLDGFRAYEVRVVTVTSAAEPTPTRARLSVDALRGVPLVVSPPGYFSRGRLEAACRTAGFEPHVEVESSSPAALLALAEAGVGTAILADDAAPHERAVTLTAAGQPLTDEVWLYRLASRTDPAAEAFFAHARAAALAGVRPRRSRRPAVDDGP